MTLRQGLLPIHGEAEFDSTSYFDGAFQRKPFYKSSLGVLFAEDCLKTLPTIKPGVIDTVFADPPFNIGKVYGKNTNDSVSDSAYLDWCKEWLEHCVRVLKPGGSLFLYNLPKWNLLLGAHLSTMPGMTFRHWIAIEMSTCMPIPGRLYPSHYSLLYFTKGSPNKFYRVRTPIQTCRHCGKEIKDYGGHRDAMNPNGVSLKDVWTDIPPVRHWKFKSKERKANALSTKLVDRVVEMSTDPHDIVLDPFGGSGTTYVVCEYKQRHWIGSEIDFAKEIADRMKSDEISAHANDDYTER